MKERDCANCKHHTSNGCSSWDCEFEAKDLISRADAIKAVHEYYQKRFTEDSKWDADAKMLVLEDKTIAKDNMEICNIIKALPSAEIPTEITNIPTNTPTDLISRADVLEGLKHSTAYLHDDIYTIVNRTPTAETTGALDDAIAKYVADGLMELPSADAVSREQYDYVCGEYNKLVHNAICIKLCDENCEYEKEKTCYHAREHYAVDSVLPADAKQGEWIEKYNGNGWNDFWDYTCSNCGKKYERADAVLYHANYCPNCGARMKGGAE